MNKLRLVSTLMVLSWRSVHAQDNVGAREFRLDAGHSDVEFDIGFMMSHVRGRFSGLRGAMFVDEKHPSNSSITVVIDAASINTGSAHRDEHLQSPDFFDVKKFPVVTFQSSSVQLNKSGSFIVTGAFTLHGVTKSITIPFKAAHPVYDDPHGSTLVTYNGNVRLARKDFGIMGGNKYNDWFDAMRSATMNDSVDISLTVAGWITDFARVTDATMLGLASRIEKDGIQRVIDSLKAQAQQNPKVFAEQEWTLDQLGRVLLYRKRNADALALFRTSATLYPRSAQAQTGLGMALEANGDTAGARAAYANALEADRYYPQGMERLRRLSNRR